MQGHRDGHGFIVRDDGGPDLYVPSHVMHTVLHQDRVKATIASYDRKGRPEANITEIVSRQQKLIIGRLLQENGVWLVAPEDNRYPQDILIPEQALAHAESGQVVTVELTEPPTLHSQPVGRIVEVLGQIDDPGMEIEIAVRKYNVPHVFSPEALEQAQALPDKVKPADWRNRVDLTDVPLVTIDGEDSRDFDDAVYCEPARVGKGQGYRLLVAIADVSFYVKPGTALDDDAYDRATSVYFPRRVIPMLPEKISNGLCSLNPDVERLCMVCDMLITAQGKVHAYQFYPAVMKSHARLTYTEVAAILTNTNGPEALRRSEHVQDLLHLYELYQALYQAREKRGAIDFDTVETRIICDEAGQIEKIEPYERTEAHRLIEEAMLAANVCAAEFIEHHKRIALFRVHEGPTPEKRELLQNYLRAIGVDITLSEEPTTKEFQRIAELTKNRPDASQIQMMLLRSMQQAIYSPINSGHFGLAYTAYTHFTSPIRRYPDLLVHRVIRGILANRKYKLDDRTAVSNLESAPKPKEAAAQKGGKPHTGNTGSMALTEMEHWVVAGLHCSANERRADEASRDVLAWLKCVYIREHLGEEFTGTVSAVTSFGLFVQLESMYVEGLIHISELGGDYYRFDELRQELRGERTGVRYALGTRVHVQVSRVDLDGRRIDFRLVPNGLAGQSKPVSAQNKAASKNGKAAKKANQPAKHGQNGGTGSALDQLKSAVKRAAHKATKAAKIRRPKAKHN
ncbi:Ribonuclease R [Saezia sanguinis]|uniref:Ribonuclease R n=1 Tax=Saezia sanguinis TaxID=1965230 RepID=A0A433SFE3_9BURK|nr:Ribonuclease R [Saezia sanguinis]